MANHWVCKNDGRIQCQNDPEITLDEMRKQLASLIGDDNILAQKKIQTITPKMCGIPAGSLNAYEVTPHGYFVLMHGFVGPMGFHDCPGDAGERAAAEQGGDHDQARDLDLSSVMQAVRATSAASHPTLVRELIGSVVRVYEQGAPVTLDWRPGRTNIVTHEGRIVDIWFG